MLAQKALLCGGFTPQGIYLLRMGPVRLQPAGISMPKSISSSFTLCVVLFFTSMCLYFFSLGPTFSWGDHADLPHRAVDWTDDTFYFARTYWLYRLIAQPFLLLPIGDIAYRLNLMTAVFGAATVATVGFIVYQRTRCQWSASLAALSLAVSHTLWFLSVIAEVYTLAAFLLTLVIAAGLHLANQEKPSLKALAGFGFLIGLFLSHHFAALLIGPASALLMLRFLKQPRALVTVILAFLIGASPFLVQFGQTWFNYSWAGIVDTFQTNQLGFYRSNAARESVLFGAYLFYQFPVIGFATGCGWLLLSPKLAQKRDLYLLAVMATFLVWGVTNPIPDKFNAYVFFYPLFAIVIGFGLHRMNQTLRDTAFTQIPSIKHSFAVMLIGGPILLYSLVPAVSEVIGIDLVNARTCPQRDNNRYFLQPWKRKDFGARIYAEETLATAAPNSVIIVDYTLWRPLLYLQKVEQQRPDVTLVWVEPLIKEDRVTEFINQTIDHSPVYLAAIEPAHYYDFTTVRQHYRALQVGNLFRMEPIASPIEEQVRLAR